MPNQPKRLRRSTLAVPGISEKMLSKAARSNADQVFCDLEDAVAPSAKHIARQKVIEALNGLDWGNTVRSVRVNDVSTEWCHDDIIAIVEGAGENVDTIILTKPLTVSDVLFADKLLAQLEKKLKLKKRIGLECLIEDVQAMHNVWDIAHCTDRLECLTFGIGDYASSQGMDIGNMTGSDGYPGDVFHYPRYQLIIACRAAGIDPVDGPYADFKNSDAFAQECYRAKTLGMVGKWAIHPAQIQSSLEIFSPSPEEVSLAREIIEVYRKAESEGIGSVGHKGMMVDAASARLFQYTVDRANLMGL